MRLWERKWCAFVLWCVYYSVSFQSFVLRHFRNTKQLPVVSIQSRFDTSRFDTNSSSEILGEYLRSLSQVRGTIYTSNEQTCIEMTCIETTLYRNDR